MVGKKREIVVYQHFSLFPPLFQKSPVAGKLKIWIVWYRFNHFPNKPWFLRVCSTSLLKTLWEKEKLLVTSNFSFSHSVFHPFRKLSAIFIEFEIVVCKLFQFEGVQNVSFGKGLRRCTVLYLQQQLYWL